MKYLLLVVIKAYWNLIPPKKRNRCLFKTSCSNHVYLVTKEQGFIKGVKALKNRIETCRPGYTIMELNQELHVITANHKIFALKDMRSDLID